MISFSESNLYFQNTSYGVQGLPDYNDHLKKLTSTFLLQLQNEIGFNQLRFYCHKKKVGTVFHIMTNINPLGEAVVKYFIDDKVISTQPQACGSYTVLPDDNSTLSQYCSKLGWNGTHADGKWAANWATGVNRILQSITRREDKYRFYSFPHRRDCDDYESEESSLTPGDSWAIFVR